MSELFVIELKKINLKVKFNIEVSLIIKKNG